MNDIADSTSAPANHHAVRFYESDRALSVIVAQFLHDGLVAGSPAVVVAAPGQRAGIVRELAALGSDVVQLQRAGDLVLLDAKEMLSTFMTKSGPDAELFTNSMCAVLNRACRSRENCTVRVYGQMVDILWESGTHDAAIRLEMLWNQLATTEAFSLLCGYAMGGFYKEVDFDRVCSHHTHVVSSDGQTVKVAQGGQRRYELHDRA